MFFLSLSFVVRSAKIAYNEFRTGAGGVFSTTRKCSTNVSIIPKFPKKHLIPACACAVLQDSDGLATLTRLQP